jgi:hypothetical protein
MAAHPLILLDGPTQLGNQLLTYFKDLFTPTAAITALALAFVLALLGLGISYFFLRPKEVCSMVCSIHFLTVIGALLAGLLGGFGLADATFKDSGSLITGAGVALVALAIPLWILVKSFDWVVLSNKHARRHRDLRTRQDKRVRNWTVFLVPLLLGGLLIAVGAALSSQNLTPVQEVFTLLGILWVLALGYEIISWLRARQRRRKLKHLGSGPALDREAAARLWTGGIGSYRIGRGETEAIHWETFTERVVITEELLLEEDRELDLVTVEEQETRASGLILAGAAAGAAGGPAVEHGMRVGPNPHLNEHLAQRQSQPGRFRQRWGLIIFMAVIAVIAIIVAASSGVSFNTPQGQGVIIAFLAPVLFLILNRFRRDSERKFATEMVDKVATVQPIAVATPARPASGAPSAAAGAAGSAQAAPPPPGLRPTRPTPVVPPATPPVIPPKEPEEPPTMPSVDAAAAASAAALAAGQAHANPDIADDTLIMRPEAIAPAPVSAGADDAEAQEMSQALQGASFPANRRHLLERARANKAPRHIITWLETLSVTTTFASTAVLIERYRKHRAAAKAEDAEQTITVAPRATAAPAPAPAGADDAEAQEVSQALQDASYPATAGQLLEHARRKKVSRRIITWLETVEVTTVFTSVVTVTEHYRRYRAAAAKAGDAEQTITIAPSVPTLAEDEEKTITPAPAGRRITTSIKITDFQRYLHGIRYPVNRAQLLERARANNAPENMLARLGELDETYTFHGVTEVMRGYVFYHYLRTVNYPATRDQLLTEARSRKATRSLLVWLESVSITIVFTTATEAMQSYAGFKVAEGEMEEEVEVVEEEEATLTPMPQAQASEEDEEDEEDDEEEEVEGQGSTRVRRIRITEFQHHLRGTDYPADRAELLENARKNGAPENMIAILEELDPTYEFQGVRDVMRGYSYHRYLYGISYPTTRAQLLERARANKASGSLLRWLETLSETASFASMGDVLKSAARRS